MNASQHQRPQIPSLKQMKLRPVLSTLDNPKSGHFFNKRNGKDTQTDSSSSDDMSERGRRELQYHTRDLSNLSYLRLNRHEIKVQSIRNHDRTVTEMDRYFDTALSNQNKGGNQNFTRFDSQLLDNKNEMIKLRRSLNRSMLDQFMNKQNT